MLAKSPKIKKMHATNENDVAQVSIEFPRSRSLWAIVVGSLLLCSIFYSFYGGFLTFCLFIAVILIIFYYLQDILLYHPELPANSRLYIPVPTMINLPSETVHIRTSDKVSLHAFWIAQPNERSKTVPTIVFFHGNAGNIGHRISNAWGMFHHLSCNVLLVEYRGYGLSTGAPSERGMSKDSRAAIDYLFTRHDLDHTKIVIFGRSLGGAVTIDLVADAVYSQKIMCGIVENTFTSIPDMGIELIHPSFRFIPSILYKNKFHSLYKIRKCSVPFLFISGLADTLVPPRMMRKLYTECGSDKKKILEFVGGTHNDTWIADGYYQGLRSFIYDCQNITLPLQKPPEKTNLWYEIHEV